jgi:hypothetical protein
MRRCCARCLEPVSIYESSGCVNGKVLHLACIEFKGGDIVEPMGPRMDDNVERCGTDGWEYIEEPLSLIGGSMLVKVDEAIVATPEYVESLRRK